MISSHPQKNAASFLPLSVRFLTEFTQNFYYILLPVLVLVFHAEATLIKLTVAIFFLGLTVGYFFAGPVVDFYDHKKIMGYNLVLFIIGSMLCLLTPGVYGLMMGRFLQGVASGILQVLSKAFISSRDTSQSKRYAFYNSLISATAPISMILTSIFLDFTSWRASFLFLFFLPMFIWIYSIRRQASGGYITRKSFRFVEAFKPYLTLISNAEFSLLMLSYCVANILLVPFFISAPYIFTHVLHLPSNAVGIVTGMLVPINILGSYASLIFVRTRYERYVIIIGIAFVVIGCFQFLINSLIHRPSIENIIVPLVFYAFGVSFFYAKFNVAAMKFFGTISINVTYSLTLLYEGLLSSVASGLSAFLKHDSFIQTALFMFVLSLIAAVLFMIFVRVHYRMSSQTS